MKKVLIVLLVALVSFCVFADDFVDDFDSFSDTSFEDFDDFDNFDDFGDFGDSFNSEPKVQLGGNIITDLRYYLNDDENPVKFLPEAKLNLDYNADKAGFKLVLDVNEDRWENSKIDIIDELSINANFGNFDVEAGKLKVVWGKGDKYHVIDNFNSMNMVNFIVPDYVDRRISIPMIRAAYSIPTESNIKIEGIYTPFIAKDRYNTDGALVPYTAKALQGAITKTVGTALATALASSPANVAVVSRANEINNDNNKIYPNLYRLKYGQFGARVTGTFKRVDWGLSYFNGFYKTPSLNAQKLAAWSADITKKADFLEFDRKQTLGIEAASTIWHFNVRGEVAVNLTDDSDGKNPWKHNSSLQWIGGFDIDLPLWNMNFNLQETGTCVFNGKKCDENTAAYAARGAKDVDYNKNGYWENMFIANLSASFMHDKLKPEISALWCIEGHDFVLMPKVTYNLTPNLAVNILMLHVYCRDNDSKFAGFNGNDCVQLGANFSF